MSKKPTPPYVRKRLPPVNCKSLYGDFASEMIPGTHLHDQFQHRTAYVHITGCYPSHLRQKNTAIMRQVTEPYRRPTSIDGRGGRFKLKEDAKRHLKVESHPMVKTVRKQVAHQFKIQQNRGHNTRRGFGKIFMFQIDPESLVKTNLITVTLEGAIKQGWD